MCVNLTCSWNFLGWECLCVTQGEVSELLEKVGNNSLVDFPMIDETLHLFIYFFFSELCREKDYSAAMYCKADCMVLQELYKYYK